MHVTSVARERVGDPLGGFEGRRAVRVGLVTFGAALAAAGALLAGGAPLPPPGPTLALVALVALAINRGAVFSSELTATAEPAVYVVAIVVFRESALALGPFLVALAGGFVDVLHWRQRSFVRMAHNAGNIGLQVLVASAVFGVVLDAMPSSPWAVGAATLAAAATYVLADAVTTLSLVFLHGPTSWRDAIAHTVRIGRYAAGFALVGAGAAVLWTEVGWWATAAVLLPAAFAPELTAVRATRVGRWAAEGVWAAPAGAAVLLLALTGRELDVGGIAVLVAGVAAGAVLLPTWGATPWPSGRLGLVLVRRRFHHQRAALVVVSGASSVAAIVVATADTRTAVYAAATGSQLAVAFAAVGVRQWRFDPARRRALAGILLAATAAIAVGYPVFGPRAPGAGLVGLVMVVAIVDVVAWPLGRLAEAATPRAAEAAVGARRGEDGGPV